MGMLTLCSMICEGPLHCQRALVNLQQQRKDVRSGQFDKTTSRGRKKGHAHDCVSSPLIVMQSEQASHRSKKLLFVLGQMDRFSHDFQKGMPTFYPSEKAVLTKLQLVMNVEENTIYLYKIGHLGGRISPVWTIW